MAFKKDFLWGASTSAYQVEGGYNEGGKGASVQDVKKIPDGTPDFKVCSDHYHRYKEDIKLFNELGLKAYRFSIAWTRILPTGDGEVNKEGIDFYNNIINECKKYNIEPIVTMYHFDLPYELDKVGGWSNDKTVDAFEKFAKVLFENYGDRVKYWLTINEQNIMTLMGSVIGTGDSSEIYQDNHRMLLAQAKAMILCHKMLPNAKIGPAPNISAVYPNSNTPEDNLAAQYANVHRNWQFLDACVFGIYNKLALEMIKSQGYKLEISEDDIKILKNAKPDFIAFNYYNTSTVKASQKINDSTKIDQQNMSGVNGFFEQVDNKNLQKTEFGWEVDPVGFRVTLNEIYSRYNLPLMITENGLGAYDKLEDGKVHDDYRIKYLKDHIEQMRRATESGVEILSYNPWSAIDLISTHEGFLKRYGFIYVDRDNESEKTLNRYKKDSFFWYKKVIESNGEELD
ncbi:MAG: glycoside hydrolase family 1 protein [Tissierellia bacterium]|nr:glycoside hydrolase family 1 protein [Tissierellia bacterium]